MENNTNELLVVAGPFQGRRFAVPAEGIRLGRSSSCEISIPDPLLSRNQCLFELRDGVVYITDLASANGTEVNGEELGAASRVLELGDRVQAGDSELVLVEAGMDVPDGDDAEPVVDLGFSQQNDGAPVEETKPAGGSSLRLILWLVLVLVLGGSAAAILLMPMGGGVTGSVARPLAPAKLWSVSYEIGRASCRERVLFLV